MVTPAAQLGFWESGARYSRDPWSTASAGQGWAPLLDQRCSCPNPAQTPSAIFRRAYPGAASVPWQDLAAGSVTLIMWPRPFPLLALGHRVHLPVT